MKIRISSGIVESADSTRFIRGPRRGGVRTQRSMRNVTRVILRVLLAHHRRVCIPLGLTADQILKTPGIINECTIEYRRLCNTAQLGFITNSLGSILKEIADLCHENGWPPLNALVVSAETWMPSDGYDKGAGCHSSRWPEEAAACIAFRGYPETV